MHMSDALITPVIGGAMMMTTLGLGRYAIKNIDKKTLEEQVPMMGVAGAFVFAAQMINFSIPGTGSSGHIGGGLLLAALLGPHAGFLVMAGILLVQALFFADGGLLALGCNIFNLGFYTCYVAYPYIYKPLLHKSISKNKSFSKSTAVVIACVIGLQLGALSVVAQTVLSGQADIPLGLFLGFMQPIHLVIGIVEGLITASVLSYLDRYHGDRIMNLESSFSSTGRSYRKPALIMFIAAVIIGGVFSHFASENPDGLEWSIEGAGLEESLESRGDSKIESTLEALQSRIAFLPDYGLRTPSTEGEAVLGTSISGIAGSVMTLASVFLLGRGIKIAMKRKSAEPAEEPLQ